VVRVAAIGVEIDRRGPVGWILIGDYQRTVEAAAEDPAVVGVHEGVGVALDELRWDRSVRAIVITGANDGEFYRFSRRSHWDDPRFRDRLNPLKAASPSDAQPLRVRSPRHAAGDGVHRLPNAHEVLMLVEKPVIARVNGDAIGFGMSLLWGCDLIVAREDARIAWGHTGMGRVVDSDGEARGFPFAITPSYGSVSLLTMPPAKLKEWMWLSKVYSGREMADMNAINYAVPAAELDEVVDGLVAGLLELPDAVLARTKRLINKRLLAQWVQTEDLADAFSGLDMLAQATTEHMRERDGA
jgi:enoyl-CoA hydratase